MPFKYSNIIFYRFVSYACTDDLHLSDDVKQEQQWVFADVDKVHIFSYSVYCSLADARVGSAHLAGTANASVVTAVAAAAAANDDNDGEGSILSIATIIIFANKTQKPKFLSFQFFIYAELTTTNWTGFLYCLCLLCFAALHRPELLMGNMYVF